jgi:ComF family protein
LRFLLPWACAGCRAPLACIEDEGFCGRCWLKIPRIDGCICRACGVPLRDGGNLCFSCRENPLKILVRSAGVFAGPLAASIHRFKYAGRKSLQHPYIALMDYAWRQYPELRPVDAIVPVPLHRGNLRDRGYNQAALLADGLGGSLELPVLSTVLIRSRRTRPQVGLNKARRMGNLDGAFTLAPGAAVKGLHLLLVDDVCTTGATLIECAGVLKSAGAAGIRALTLARDVQRPH